MLKCLLAVDMSKEKYHPLRIKEDWTVLKSLSFIVCNEAWTNLARLDLLHWFVQLSGVCKLLTKKA